MLTAPCYRHSDPLPHYNRQQASPTCNTKKLVHQFLDYTTTNPDARIITNRASDSDMILAGQSDASYLSDTNAHSRAGGHFFISNANNDLIPSNNGAVLMISQII